MAEPGTFSLRRVRLATLLVGVNVALMLVTLAGLVYEATSSSTSAASAGSGGEPGWLLALIVLSAAASVAGLFLHRRFSGEVRQLTAAAERIGRGDLATPVPRVEGEETGDLAATLDETRRRLNRLTAELRRRQAEGEAILTGVAEGVFSVDRDRRIAYLNPQAAELLGIRPEEALGRFCGDVLRPASVDGDRPCDEHCPIVHARFRGASRATERLQLADGGIRTVVLTSSPPAEERQFQVLSDETELEAARRLRDAVLANISHEFKTPLAGQRASLELLREHLLEGSAPAVDPVTVGLFAALERGGLRLTQLIDNLLESVRIEAGSPPLRRQRVALDEVVEEAAEVARPLLAQRGQSLEIELPFPLPEVDGDAPRLTQVFVNLLANANKFGPEGGAVRIGGAVDRGQVRLWVEDGGPGFPPPSGDGRSLFERFVRSAERQADPEASGMGLGLWIVQSIVERHGGRVEVGRDGGGASRVVVALPRGAESEAPSA
jgi:signal transduction histidine kinase